MDKQNLAELDYPMPDPTWDYCEVYVRAIVLHREATAMSEQERASPEADQAIRDSLRKISRRVNEMMGQLD